jgi:hypothetical protein
VKSSLPLGLALLLLGCGYHFVAQGMLPGGVHEVAAPVFANRTAEPALEATFTHAFRDELNRRGELASGSADATLKGEILSVYGAPSTNPLATYRLTARLRLTLLKGTEVIGSADVSGSEDYLPAQAGDVLLSEANRQAALTHLAQTLARNGLDRLSDLAP